MKLWLVRHGEAAPMQADDAARELTARGQADIRALGNLLARDHVRVDQIIVSPYVRARQTCELLQQQNAWPVEPIVEQAMTPDSVIEHVLQILSACDEQHSLLVVSHQPLVSSLTALLVDGRSDFAFHYPMSPGSLAVIDLPVCAPGQGRLEKLLSPPYER